MISRVAAVAVALVLVVGMTTGCQPEPAPSPSGPIFANEDEAFAAAEQTYRAYVDALNQVDLSDPETFEAVYAWTTGDANAEARKLFSQMHADSWVVRGESLPTIVNPRVWGGPTQSQMEVSVCLDVSRVELLNEAGESVVSPDRPDVQSMLVNMFTSLDTATGWIIEDFEGRDGEPTCD
ncbi:hypothetical protein [Microbacterium sp.]|uniref:hypothetical protein n=1 Tax=Microbacterium sp. TaxID=51671 RepID=UPI0025E5B8A1|nr:hypothetical protein [Microbacterium sp.]